LEVSERKLNANANGCKYINLIQHNSINAEKDIHMRNKCEPFETELALSMK